MSDGLELRDVEQDADGAWTAGVRVDPDSPWFAGHFPGEPVLPAMAQIGLVARLAGEATEAGHPTGLPNLRLSRQVAPGDRLTLRLVPGDGHCAAFRLDGPQGRVSDGTMAWGGTPPPPAEGAAAARGPEQRDPDAELPPVDLLPHAPPALLVREVRQLGDAHIVCRGAVPADNAAVVDGGSGPWMALELAAQAAGLLQAAMVGRRDSRVGYIVRIRDAGFLRPRLPAAVTLDARVDHQGGSGPLTLYRVGVERDGAAVVTATLATFLPVP